MPEKEQYQPRSIASWTRQGARKQWRITGDSVAARVEDLEDVVDRAGLVLWVAGVDHDRQVALAGDLDLGFEGPALVRPAGRFAVVVDPGLADRPHLLVLGGQAGDLGGPGVVEARGLGRVTADGGEDAPRSGSAAATAAGFVSASRPTLSIRSTPASRAAATTSSSGRSQRKRWVWESITPTPSLSPPPRG